MVTYRELGFSRDQPYKLGQVYDVLGVKKDVTMYKEGQELSWADMFQLGRIADVRIDGDEGSASGDRQDADRHVPPVVPEPGTTALGPDEIKLIENSANRVKKKEELHEYMDFIEAGSVYFDEVINDDRVSENILLDTITVEDGIVRMDLKCCNSANPGLTTLRDRFGAEKECKYFDNKNHLFLQAVVLASLSLFLNLRDTGERSSEQGTLVQNLLQQGFDSTEIRREMLKALGLEDRSLLSAGAEKAIVRVYSGKILRVNTSLIEHWSGTIEELVRGWNVHELCISREIALAIAHAYFVEVDIGQIALLLACSIDDEDPTFNRVFIDCCAIWVVDYGQKNTPRECERKGESFACKDTPLCYGEMFPFSSLPENLRPRLDRITALTIDVILSEAVSGLTFSSTVGSVQEQLNSLFIAEHDVNGPPSEADQIRMNTGLAKLSAVLLAGTELELEFLAIASPRGASIMERRHRLDNDVFRYTSIMEALSQFNGKEYKLRQIDVPYPPGLQTYGSVPARTEAMRKFVRETGAVPVGRRDTVRRLWQMGVYHLSLSESGLFVSMFPHREGGVRLWKFGGHAGPQGGTVDLRNLSELAEGGYGPTVLEDVIEHHELANIQIPSTRYTCYVRNRGNKGEPVVQSLRPINLAKSKRFATDGKNCGTRYVETLMFVAREREDNGHSLMMKLAKKWRS